MRWFWTLLPAALLGCESEGPQFGGVVSPDATVSDADPIVPEEGDWILWSTEAISDTCGLRVEDTGDEPLTENFNLGNATETSFEIRRLDFELGWIEVQCAIDGISYDCGPFDYVYEVPAVDAVLTTSWSVRGDMVDATELGGINGTAVSCEGEDCTLVEGLYGMTFPCGFSDYFSATWNEEESEETIEDTGI